MEGGNVPERLRKMSARVHGWHVGSGGEQVLVSHRVWAFGTPEPKFTGQQFPLRTTWAFVSGEWRLLENEINWPGLEDPNAFIPNGPAGVLVIVFQNPTRKEACLDDVRQERERPRRPF